MDGNGFISSVENNLVTLAPITKFIITKQLNDLQVNKDSITPEKARKMMMKQLRVHAPGYFDNQGQATPGTNVNV